MAEVTELVIAKPAVDKGELVVTGNFEEAKAYVRTLVEKYKGLTLTDANVGECKAVKAQFVKLRNSIDRERKSWKSAYITPASKTIDALCEDLQKIVAEGEDAIGSQLDAFEQRRKDELTGILNGYVLESANAHGLRDEYKAMIELKDKYYNKTQDEEDSIADIEAQAVELEKQQKDYDCGCELIHSECEGTTLIEEHYTRKLGHVSIAEIVLEIKKDKVTLAEMLKKVEKDMEEKGKITVGKAVPVKQSEKPDSAVYKTGVFRLTYRAEQSREIEAFFAEKGIKAEKVQP